VSTKSVAQKKRFLWKSAGTKVVDKVDGKKHNSSGVGKDSDILHLADEKSSETLTSIDLLTAKGASDTVLDKG